MTVYPFEVRCYDYRFMFGRLTRLLKNVVFPGELLQNQAKHMAATTERETEVSFPPAMPRIEFRIMDVGALLGHDLRSIALVGLVSHQPRRISSVKSADAASGRVSA